MSLEKTLKKYRTKIKQIKLEQITRFIKSQLGQYKRVLRRSKKPSRTEFLDVTKITGIGLLLIGVIGFLIQTIFLKIIKL